ncbi:hypothetical protein D3C74_326670 [compost metagenome]
MKVGVMSHRDFDPVALALGGCLYRKVNIRASDGKRTNLLQTALAGRHLRDDQSAFGQLAHMHGHDRAG